MSLTDRNAPFICYHCQSPVANPVEEVDSELYHLKCARLNRRIGRDQL